MNLRYIVLGAGRQGLAIAHDLGRSGEANHLTLVDADRKALKAGAARLRGMLPGHVAMKTIARTLTGPETATLLRGHDAAVSAMPYRFNPALARAAIRAGVHFCDLGGNTDLVKEELRLDAQAKRAGVTIVPDCGLAPGLGNVLASIAVDEVSGARHVAIRCGGLPVPPRGTLNYSLLFDIAGLTNEYTGRAMVLRKGSSRTSRR
jgi:lysine 6-dehydrogenase